MVYWGKKPSLKDTTSLFERYIIWKISTSSKDTSFDRYPHLCWACRKNNNASCVRLMKSFFVLQIFDTGSLALRVVIAIEWTIVDGIFVTSRIDAASLVFSLARSYHQMHCRRLRCRHRFQSPRRRWEQWGLRRWGHPNLYANLRGVRLVWG